MRHMAAWASVFPILYASAKRVVDSHSCSKSRETVDLIWSVWSKHIRSPQTIQVWILLAQPTEAGEGGWTRWGGGELRHLPMLCLKTQKQILKTQKQLAGKLTSNLFASVLRKKLFRVVTVENGGVQGAKTPPEHWSNKSHDCQRFNSEYMMLLRLFRSAGHACWNLYRRAAYEW